jgi:hypothetical protein
VLSLHHVEPLGPSCRRLGELLRPGAPFAIDEMDVDRLDERAARWWLDQQARLGAEPEKRPAELISEMRHHLHSFAEMRGALEPCFHVGDPVRGPYLHRWHLPSGLRAPEERLIAAGVLPVMGARMVAVRRPLR